jgi:hypothetical protein
MSKVIRVLALVAMVAAMHLAGMAVVAQAHPADQVTGQDARRPPTERQVGRPGASVRRPHHGRPPWTPLSGSCSGTAPPSPAGHPQRDTRPDASPTTRRIERTVRLARRFTRCPGRGHGPHRGARRAGRQASQDRGNEVDAGLEDLGAVAAGQQKGRHGDLRRLLGTEACGLSGPGLPGHREAG